MKAWQHLLLAIVLILALGYAVTTTYSHEDKQNKCNDIAMVYNSSLDGCVMIARPWEGRSK